jgi:hypothetical protein
LFHVQAVGIYLLRKVPGAEGFSAAREEAQGIGVLCLNNIAMERAIYGVPRPIFYKDRQVGEVR